MPPVMKVICVSLLIPNSYGKVLYGFIVICANIARPCTYNVPVTSILMYAVPILLIANYVNARNHRLVCLHEGYFSYWKSYLTSWSCFIHPTGTGLHYPLITKDVSRSYRQSLSKGRIYLQAKSVQPYREYRPALPSPHYQRQGNQIR